MQTSVTIASSIALRLRHLAGRVHALGPGPLYHFLCELAGGADLLDRAERYGALPADFIEANGGRDLPSLRRVK